MKATLKVLLLTGAATLLLNTTANAQGYNYRSTWRPSTPITVPQTRSGAVMRATADLMDEYGLAERLRAQAEERNRQAELARQEACRSKQAAIMERVRQNDEAYRRYEQALQAQAAAFAAQMEAQRRANPANTITQDYLNRYGKKGPTIQGQGNSSCNDLDRLRREHPETIHGHYIIPKSGTSSSSSGGHVYYGYQGTH